MTRSKQFLRAVEDSKSEKEDEISKNNETEDPKCQNGLKHVIGASIRVLFKKKDRYAYSEIYALF